MVRSGHYDGPVQKSVRIDRGRAYAFNRWPHLLRENRVSDAYVITHLPRSFLAIEVEQSKDR